MRDPVLHERARTMRRDATPPERALWRVLRAPPFKPLHFRRQVVFEARYIADFASRRARVVVEADGRSHDATLIADIERDRWFAARGYRVIRLSNAEIVNPDADLAATLLAILGPLPF